MRIAIFDYHVNTTNAIGHCFHLITEGLKDEHQITVFAASFDNPDPERIEFVRVPVISRPLFVLFLCYYVMAKLVFWRYQLQHHVKFDIIQSAEVNVFNRDLIYPHFCNAAYLKDHWKTTHPEGLHRLIRWLDHQLRAWVEPLAFRTARQIIVPSDGLAREITELFGEQIGSKIRVIADPVDIQRMKRPADFDREKIRQQYGFSADDLVLVFVALGHFERKGLPLLLSAIKATGNPHIKLMIVGGTSYMIHTYQERVAALGIADQVVFVGTQKDTRPYLWSADLFAFPSAYETFSLVTIEACAAGLPVLVSRLHGVEDYLVDGVNGWLIERTTEAITDRLDFVLANRSVLAQIGATAADSVKSYDSTHYVQKWRAFYRDYADQYTAASPQDTPSQAQAK